MYSQSRKSASHYFYYAIWPFKYLHALYGISSISEYYDRCMYEAFDGLLGFHLIVDDIVIYVNDAKQHVIHV